MIVDLILTVREVMVVDLVLTVYERGDDSRFSFDCKRKGIWKLI